MAKQSYDPKTYEAFGKLRRPALDVLLSLIQVKPNMKVLDMGCGSGDFTERLSRHLNSARMLGVEPSANMRAAARARNLPKAEFVHGEIDTFETTEKFDLIFCNGVLHYAHDQGEVLRRMRSWLQPGGQIALQLPSNRDTYAIQVGRDLAWTGEFASHLAHTRSTSGALKLEEYAQFMHDLKFCDQIIRMQAHVHPLDQAVTLYRWLEQTFLNTFQEEMPTEVFSAFEERYRAEFQKQFPFDQPCLYILKRLYIWARIPD